MKLLERDLPFQSAHCPIKYRPARTSDLEKVAAVKSARIAWENGINEELVAIATEKQRPFAMLLFVTFVIHLMFINLDLRVLRNIPSSKSSSQQQHDKRLGFSLIGN